MTNATEQHAAANEAHAGRLRTGARDTAAALEPLYAKREGLMRDKLAYAVKVLGAVEAGDGLKVSGNIRGFEAMQGLIERTDEKIAAAKAGKAYRTQRRRGGVVYR
jgi:hypothetical protein